MILLGIGSYSLYNFYGFNFKNQQGVDQLYSFFVAGHPYGNPRVRKNSNDGSSLGIYAPLYAGLEEGISRYGINFGVFTGDIVCRSIPPEWDAVDQDISRLGIPIHFAPGNHDVKNRDLFVSRYGSGVERKTYWHFEYQSDLFIILDPNIDGWNISGAS